MLQTSLLSADFYKKIFCLIKAIKTMKLKTVLCNIKQYHNFHEINKLIPITRSVNRHYEITLVKFWYLIFPILVHTKWKWLTDKGISTLHNINHYELYRSHLSIKIQKFATIFTYTWHNIENLLGFVESKHLQTRVNIMNSDKRQIAPKKNYAKQY